MVVIDAETRPVVVVGRPPAGNRNDCKAWEKSGAKSAVGRSLSRCQMRRRRREGRTLCVASHEWSVVAIRNVLLLGSSNGDWCGV
ncbi:hypothetical protein GCM10023088_07560 [Actinomadura verrucosospora]